LRIVPNLNSQADLGRRVVIASQRVGAKRRPMTGSAKQSMERNSETGLLRRFAPLRKRFAFVAGNDSSIQIQLRNPAARCARGL
jgi:hypothetical protein